MVAGVRISGWFLCFREGTIVISSFPRRLVADERRKVVKVRHDMLRLAKSSVIMVETRLTRVPTARGHGILSSRE